MKCPNCNTQIQVDFGERYDLNAFLSKLADIRATLGDSINTGRNHGQGKDYSSLVEGLDHWRHGQKHLTSGGILAQCFNPEIASAIVDMFRLLNTVERVIYLIDDFSKNIPKVDAALGKNEG